MSLDRSLKGGGSSLTGHRSVLKRVERIAKLRETKDYDPKKQGAIGLPKTKNLKIGA